jgi:hypothetical protein
MSKIIVPYVNTLFVADGIFRFGPPDPSEAFFTLDVLKNTLKAGGAGGVKFKVTTAHRRHDPAADIPDFVFSKHDLLQYDVIWLFGYEGANVHGKNSEWASLSLPDADILALTAFMNKGGGVMAAGDHDGLGSVMCGQIPRVRSMRKWFAETDPPPGVPPNAPGLGAHRLDTTRPDHNNQFWFDNQSDDIPQVLTVLHSHPVLQSPNGLITKFPDHMHEGEVTVPWEGLPDLVIGGQKIEEYPSLFRISPTPGPITNFVINERPVVIATGTTLGGHPTPTEGLDWQQFQGSDDESIGRTFSAICVYDGLRVGVGRVLTQSSFHHFIDLNLTGDGLGVGDKQLGFQTVGGERVLEGLQRYFCNVGFWLAEQTHWYPAVIYYVSQLAWWRKLIDPGGPVEQQPERILEYGTLMRQALARYISDDMSVDFVRTIMERSGLSGLLPDRPWQGRTANAGLRSYGRIVEAALGGAAMELMAADARASLHDAQRTEIRKIALEGLHTGLRALGGLLIVEAEAQANRAQQLRRAGRVDVSQ